jgi:ATP-binding cassette subfamily B protein
MLPTTTFSFVFHFFKKQWGKFLILIVADMVWALNNAFFPYFVKRIVDILQYFEGERAAVYGALLGTLILIAIFWIFMEVILRAQGMVQIYLFPQFRANIRKDVFNYLKKHSHEYFSNHFAGNLAKKLADLPEGCQVIMEIICFQFISGITAAAAIFFLMWQIQPIFAGILIAWLCTHVGLTLLFLRYGHNLWKQHADARSILNGKIVDVLTNMPNVRLFSRSHHETEYLNTFQQEEIKKAQKAQWLMEWSRVAIGFSSLCMIFGMIFTLIQGWIAGWVSVGDITQVTMQMLWLLGVVWFVSFQMMMFVRETGIVGSALSLIQHAHDVVDKKAATPLVIEQGYIDIQDIHFAYQKNLEIFKGLNLHIPAGQKIGLVGFSGSGKSTFVNLILRFYDLQSGSILIDGQNIALHTQDSLRAHIAMIPQDPMLFHRTLMENIRYGRLDATDEEVINAASLANCHEFIQILPEGYQALVGERGIKLSGGQRQRIAIARAILKNAPILILDEATSSLDSATERLIQESLARLMKNKTTIVIAHRLSTLNNMDRILVFDQGKIVEDGSQADLLKHQGTFTALWNMQIDGFLPDKN